MIAYCILKNETKEPQNQKGEIINYLEFIIFR